jgi:hypothetical protein
MLHVWRVSDISPAFHTPMGKGMGRNRKMPEFAAFRDYTPALTELTKKPHPSFSL